MSYKLMTLALLAGFVQAATPLLELTSPDGRNQIRVSMEKDGHPFYEVLRDGVYMIEHSRLGMVLADEVDLSSAFRLVETRQTERRESWTQPWGEVAEVVDHCATGTVELVQNNTGHRLLLHARAYDDGVAFRYELPAQPSLPAEFELMDERSEFHFAMDPEAWWIPAYWWNRYEYLTQNSALSEMGPAHTPVTLQTGLGTCLVLHEAALTDYAGMTLKQTGGRRFEADLVPWSDGVKVRGTLPLLSPWRVLMLADSPAKLLENTVLLNLNEPSKIADTSWIRPAKYMGIWWELHLGTASWGSGPQHGATTERAKHMIDFAARNGLDGVLVEGWNTGWDGDWIANGELFNFTEAHPDFNMDEVARHAREQNVELVGHHETAASIGNYERQLDDALDYYMDHGIEYIKTGYVNHGQQIRRMDEAGEEQLEWHHGQYMVRHYRRVTEEAARRGIMLCVHEPIHDTGIRRSWPNLLSREGARGQEFNAWGARGGNPVDHAVLLATTRLLAGPMDYTPGIFDLLFEEEKPHNRVNSTLAHQLALYVVLYSPLQMLPDLPANYEARPEAFQFLLDVPVDWAETRGLAGEIGDYIVVARKDRNSEDWYLGAIAGHEAREVTLPLDFLDPGTRWQARLYRDGEAADWRSNPYEFISEERLVDSADTLTLRLAAGGGTAIRFVAGDNQ